MVAQDHKFFEKSWAFSIGPTAGLLIGLGPVERGRPDQVLILVGVWMRL